MVLGAVSTFTSAFKHRPIDNPTRSIPRFYKPQVRTEFVAQRAKRVVYDFARIRAKKHDITIFSTHSLQHRMGHFVRNKLQDR